MARVFPNGWEALAVGGAAQREIETLETLRRDLPGSYTVYHGVHWTHLDKGFAIFGEADFVVVGPSGRVLVIEQKSGPLEETPDGLAKVYELTHGDRAKTDRVAASFHLLGRVGDSSEVAHLGRFAIDYKRVFGESPSATLRMRRASR